MIHKTDNVIRGTRADHDGHSWPPRYIHLIAKRRQSVKRRAKGKSVVRSKGTKFLTCNLCLLIRW